MIDTKRKSLEKVTDIFRMVIELSGVQFGLKLYA